MPIRLFPAAGLPGAVSVALAICVFVSGASAQTLRPTIGSDLSDRDDLVVYEDDGVAGDGAPQARRVRDGAGDEGVGERSNPRAQSFGRAGLTSAGGGLTSVANPRANPIETRARRIESDPYAPQGIRIGTMRLFSEVTQSLGHSSNADLSAQGGASAFSQTTGRTVLLSDWSRHSLRLEAGAGATHYVSEMTETEHDADVSGALNLDISQGWDLILGFDYRLANESPSSVNLVSVPGLDLAGRPLAHEIKGAVALERTEGRATGLLRGSVTRSVFEHAEFTDGSRLSQSDRNNTEYQLTARAGYAMSAAVTPFVQASFGLRDHDLYLDSGGFDRDASIYEGLVGVSLDFGEKLRGELRLGYHQEIAFDQALADFGGVVLGGELIWSPVRLTTITASYETEFVESSSSGGEGTRYDIVAIDIERALRPNLTINGRGAVAVQGADSDETSTTWQAELGAEWALNRSLSVTGKLGYENFVSSDDASDYDAVTARVGITVKR